MSKRRSNDHLPKTNAGFDSITHHGLLITRTKSLNYLRDESVTQRSRLSRCRQRSGTFTRQIFLALTFSPHQLLILLVFFCCAFFAFHWQKLPEISERPFIPKGISNLKELGYPVRPRIVGYYFTSESTFIGHQNLPEDIRRWSRHFSNDDRTSLFRQEMLKDEIFYLDRMADPMEEGSCLMQHDWQVTSNPSCNNFHEIDLTNLGKPSRDTYTISAITSGHRRDAWTVDEHNGFPQARNKLKMKTLTYESSFTDREYDRHRRESLVMDQLSKSNFVTNIYGYCAMSGLTEHPTGRSLYELFHKNRLDTRTVLSVALDVARGVADVHNFGKEGIATVAHTDITSDEFIKCGERFKLHDFGRCRFIKWDKKANKACTFKVGVNGGCYRSPEEYLYTGETEKVDVYSMGNIFFLMLTGHEVFNNYASSEDAQNEVMKGLRPQLPSLFLENTDPTIKVMVRAIHMCWTQDPVKRPTARDIEKLLAKMS